MSDFTNGSARTKQCLKLIYTEERGKIDLVKLILAYLQLPYEDIRVYPSELLAYQQLSPFQQLPLLVIDEKHRISHDLPICRYLAELGHIRGLNAVEAGTCDMIVEQLRECIVVNIGEKTKMDTVERTLNGIEKLISLNEAGKYVVGDKLTWADLAMVNACEWLLNGHSNRNLLASRFPLIKAHNEFVRTLPAVQEWFSKQKPLGRVKNV